MVASAAAASAAASAMAQSNLQQPVALAQTVVEGHDAWRRRIAGTTRAAHAGLVHARRARCLRVWRSHRDRGWWYAGIRGRRRRSARCLVAGVCAARGCSRGA